MIKYKVKARIAKDIGTDNFQLEEFEKIFVDNLSPIKARKRAYSYYESTIDIINDKTDIESKTDAQKVKTKANKVDNRTGLKFLDVILKSASFRTEVGIYIMSDVNEELFKADEENMIIGYNHSIPNLTLAKNLEQEFKLYKKNNWDTEAWTVKIKYWDYEGTYEDVYKPTVLHTVEDFWEHWNPEIAKAEDKIEEESRDDSLFYQMLNSGENRNLEFKSSLRYCYYKKSAQKYIESEIIKTIAAFANTHGGTLFLGVGDDGEVFGLEKDFQTFKGNTKDKFLKHFANIIGSGFSEPIDALIKYSMESTQGKYVFLVIVEKSTKPRFVKTKNGEKEFYIRRSATSPKLNVEETVKYVIDKWHTNK